MSKYGSHGLMPIWTGPVILLVCSGCGSKVGVDHAWWCSGCGRILCDGKKCLSLVGGLGSSHVAVYRPPPIVREF